MNNTALGAENKKEQTINFISEAHEKFYYKKLKEVRYQDVYHKALCYCLGISDDTVMITLVQMLMYGKEASNRKQEVDRQHHTIPKQKPNDRIVESLFPCIF